MNKTVKNKIDSILISVIIPVYNEINTIEEIIDKINLISINKEIIIVDDCSNDGSNVKLKELEGLKFNKLCVHKKNQGKGAAIKTALEHVKGDICLIQDADLEYDPNDYFKLVEPIIERKTKVVYGSRVLGKNRYNNNQFSSKFRIFANHMLTIFSNLINNQKLTDAHTCYKVLETPLFKKLSLKENKFNFCPELTTKLSNQKISILEVPIFYDGRSYKEGKKIGIFDGFHAIYTIVKYKLIK